MPLTTLAFLLLIKAAAYIIYKDLSRRALEATKEEL